MTSIDRIKQKVVDKEGNIVISIEKYSLVESLFHSIYGAGAIAFIVGALLLLSYHYISIAIGVIVVSLFLWIASWLNANDILKQRIYSRVLHESILNLMLLMEMNH